MLVSLKELMQDAYQKGYAVGAFNTVNLASIRAVMDGAEKLNRPVILQHAQLHDSIAPLEIIGPMMLRAAKKASVPVAVHLDHGTDIDYLIQAMEMGFTSVMYDGSALDYAENVQNTHEVVKAAESFGVSVEAELGRVLRPEGGGEENAADRTLRPEDCYTLPEEAQAFIDATGIDALAIAFGTAHGVYEAEPKLDFDRIAAIRERTGMPLVMHGGSGISDDDFIRAIDKGITKVNYFTYMSLAGGKAVSQYLEKVSDPYAVRFDEMDQIARLAMQEHVEHAIKIFSR